MGGKRKKDDNAVKGRSRRPGASSRKRAAEGSIGQNVENELSSRRGRRVELPLVRSKHPGTVALDNAKIFEIIPLPLGE